MDTVKLGEGVPTHWKQRYYFEKFRIKQTDMVDFLQRIKKAYIEGVCWVMLYYYQGCPSWTWFYPYHYAPFASDLVGCSMLKAGNKGYFEKGEPFVPFEQLMSVLPPASATPAGIPEKMIQLMKDPLSPIVDFFPVDFALDLNGKRFTWQAVILLPFLEEDRLLKHVQPLMAFATDEQKQRSTFGRIYLFSHFEDEDFRKTVEEAQAKYEANGGKVALAEKDFQFGDIEGFELGGVSREIPAPIEDSEVGMTAIEKSMGIGGVYIAPKLTEHICDILAGVVPIKQEVEPAELADAKTRKGFGGDQARKLVYTHLGHLFGKDSQRDRYKAFNQKKKARDDRANEKRRAQIAAERGEMPGAPPRTGVPGLKRGYN